MPMPWEISVTVPIRAPTGVIIDILMEFMSPSPATAEVKFQLVLAADAVEFTWLVKGERSLEDQLINLALKLDKIMYLHFTGGLIQLNSKLESYFSCSKPRTSFTKCSSHACASFPRPRAKHKNETSMIQKP